MHHEIIKTTVYICKIIHLYCVKIKLFVRASHDEALQGIMAVIYGHTISYLHPQ